MSRDTTPRARNIRLCHRRSDLDGRWADGLVGLRRLLPAVEIYRPFMEAVLLRPHPAQLPEPFQKAAFLNEIVAYTAADARAIMVDARRVTLHATKAAARG